MVWNFVVLRVSILPADREQFAFVACLAGNVASEGIVLREQVEEKVGYRCRLAL